MPTATINAAAYIPFSLLDAVGGPVVGKTNADFTATAYLASTPATIAAPTVTEVGSGRYVLSVTPTATGTWHVAWSVDVDGETVRFEDVLEVITGQQANPVQYLSGQTITVAAPVAQSGAVTIYQGDDYDTDESRALTWTLTGASDLTGAAVTLTIARGTTTLLSQAGMVTNPGTATQTVTVELTAAQTADLPHGAQAAQYSLDAVLANGHVETLARGAVTVAKDLP